MIVVINLNLSNTQAKGTLNKDNAL